VNKINPKLVKLYILKKLNLNYLIQQIHQIQQIQQIQADPFNLNFSASGSQGSGPAVAARVSLAHPPVHRALMAFTPSRDPARVA
jgi:hypothetical protein